MSYFKNLLIAICGRNPYQLELDAVKEEYDQCAARVRILDEQYAVIVAQAEAEDKRTNSYTTLIENLRARLREKEDELRQYRKELKDALEQLSNHKPDERQ